jgi:hypothetical protein
VDPGVHLVEAMAPGRRPWSTQVVAADGSSLSVSIPPPPSAPAAVSVSDATPREAPAARMPLLRAIGIASGAVGVIGLGLGTYFALHALALNADSNTDGRCNNNDMCGTIGNNDRLMAIGSANSATVAFVAGGVLLAGGITLFVLGKPAATAPALTASAIGGQGIAGASVHGSF